MKKNKVRKMIRQELKNARKVLETPVYKVAKAGVKVLHIYG